MNTTPIDHKIEFMAWDKRNNRIVEVDSIDFINNQLHFFSETFNGNPSFITEYELMQLTALRSINDEPIYNHMIVKNGLGSHYVVDMFDYTIMFILSNENIEIVGNRFQHEHLLELCK